MPSTTPLTTEEAAENERKYRAEALEPRSFADWLNSNLSAFSQTPQAPARNYG